MVRVIKEVKNKLFHSVGVIERIMKLEEVISIKILHFCLTLFGVDFLGIKYGKGRGRGVELTTLNIYLKYSIIFFEN